MDSMRSLNTSLPRTSPRRRASRQQPPEALLSAFKAAALSVTTLYKNAATDQARSRAAGYQDALDDLLVFLDRENLGLGDGEGWRVRQWATERLDGTSLGRTETDEEDDEAAEGEKDRSSSPETVRKGHTQEPQTQEQPQQHEEPAHTQAESLPNIEQLQQRQTPVFTVPQTEPFSFRSSHAYPTNHDREMNTDNSSTAGDTPSHSSMGDNGPSPVRVELVSRNSRNRHNRMNHNRQTAPGLASLGSGAGSKRKTPFGDFFDLSGLSFDNKDGNGRGGKRGRHV